MKQRPYDLVVTQEHDGDGVLPQSFWTMAPREHRSHENDKRPAALMTISQVG